MGLQLGDTAAKNVYVGDLLAKAVYLGDTKVWPTTVPPVMFTEPFSDMSGGWTNFTMEQSANQAEVVSGIARLKNNSPSNTLAIGRYNRSELGTEDAFFCDVLTWTNTASTSGSSNQPLRLGLRRAASLTGKWVEFTITPAGDAILYTCNGASKTQRATGRDSGVTDGDTIRVVSRDDGFNALYVLNNSTSPVVQWTDANRDQLVYNDPAYRFMTMGQTYYNALTDYCSYAVTTVKYGNYSLRPSGPMSVDDPVIAPA